VAKNRTALLKELDPNNEDGKLPPYAWPGGYPILYITGDGGILCPACANGENGSEAANPDCADDPQWNVTAYDVYWEGPSESCAHCNADIKSAYGDPENKENNP
jgi:hypothetical protein